MHQLRRHLPRLRARHQPPPPSGLDERTPGNPNSVRRRHMTTLLRLIGASIMGILDPVPSSTTFPMSEAEGAWVRANAWTKGLRRIEDAYPHGFHRWCSCERGICHPCGSGHHEQCVSVNGPRLHEYAGTITDRGGFVVAVIQYGRGQQPCRWLCPCPHPLDDAAPAGTTPLGRLVVALAAVHALPGKEFQNLHTTGLDLSRGTLEVRRRLDDLPPPALAGLVQPPPTGQPEERGRPRPPGHQHRHPARSPSPRADTERPETRPHPQRSSRKRRPAQADAPVRHHRADRHALRHRRTPRTNRQAAPVMRASPDHRPTTPTGAAAHPPPTLRSPPGPLPPRRTRAAARRATPAAREHLVARPRPRGQFRRY
ncbi:DUF6248 family natural product biosynthesis protein [Streptomyces sp. NPDC003554]